jgi:hypothetical protein
MFRGGPALFSTTGCFIQLCHGFPIARHFTSVLLECFLPRCFLSFPLDYGLADSLPDLNRAAVSPTLVLHRFSAN